MNNWYKIATIRGEWWIIDGSAFFADAEVGDTNHSGVVIDHILSNYDLDSNNTDLTALDDENLTEMGFSKEEIDVVRDRVDPREYGMRELGWKRVAGNNIQTQTLTFDDLKDIGNGLYDIDEDIKDDDEFYIEVMGNRKFYSGVTWNDINNCNLDNIVGKSLPVMSNNTLNWYKIARYDNDRVSGWILNDGSIAYVNNFQHIKYIMKNYKKMGISKEEIYSCWKNEDRAYDFAFKHGNLRFTYISTGDMSIDGMGSAISKNMPTLHKMIKANNVITIYTRIRDSEGRTIKNGVYNNPGDLYEISNSKNNVKRFSNSDIENNYEAFHNRLSNIKGFNKKIIGYVGDSKKYPLYMLQNHFIKGRSNKMIIGVIHGNEPAGVWALLELMEHDAFMGLINDNNLSIIPILNPTGFDSDTRRNYEDKDPNRGLTNSSKDKYPSKESNIIKSNSYFFCNLCKDGYMALHEDSKRDKFYIYAYEKDSENPSNTVIDIVKSGQKFYDLADPDSFGNILTGKGKKTTKTYNGLIYGNPKDGSIEEFFVNRDITPVFCIETPSRSNLKNRIECLSSIIDKFLRM